jgi:hypothetical protein
LAIIVPAWHCAATARVGVLQVWQKQAGGWKLLARQAFCLPS